MSFTHLVHTHVDIARASPSVQAVFPAHLLNGMLRFGGISDSLTSLKDSLERMKDPHCIGAQLTPRMLAHLYHYTVKHAPSQKKRPSEHFHPMVCAFFLNDATLFDQAIQSGYTILDPLPIQLVQKVRMLLPYSALSKEAEKHTPLLASNIERCAALSQNHPLAKTLQTYSTAPLCIGHLLMLCTTYLPTSFMSPHFLISSVEQPLLAQDTPVHQPQSSSDGLPTSTARHKTPKRL